MKTKQISGKISPTKLQTLLFSGSFPHSLTQPNLSGWLRQSLCSLQWSPYQEQMNEKVLSRELRNQTTTRINIFAMGEKACSKSGNDKQQ